MQQPNNITPILQSKEAPKPARFTIAAQLDGFPVSVEAEGGADNLRSLVDRLKAIGAMPPVQTSALAAAERPAGPPRCPVHGKAMKPSQKPGAFYCPRRLDDGGYCKEVA